MKKYVFILFVSAFTLTNRLTAQIIPENDASQRTRQGDKLRLRTQSSDDILEKYTFFLVDQKVYSYQAFEKLMKNPDDIQSIDIVKDPQEIQQYTSDKKYQVVIKVTLKK